MIMARKGENIRKRKDGRWEARFRKGSDSNNVPVYASIYGKTYKEVKEKRIAALAAPMAKANPSTLNFQDVQQLWMAKNSVHLKASTRRKYTYLLQRHILPVFGSMKLSRITAPVVNAFLAEKMNCGRLDGKGGLSANYVRSIMLIINGIMLFAAGENYCLPLSSNICKPPTTTVEVPTLTPQQYEKLEAAIRYDPSPTELGIVITLYTGLRIGEICALTWDDIDLENRLITVRHTVTRVSLEQPGSKSTLVIDSPKTPASLRTIPICSRLNEILNKYKPATPSRFVVSTTDTFVSPRTFEYRFHGILKKHNIQDIHFHALRHTFATRCIERSVDVKSLSQILGHSSATITLKTYVHSSLDLKRMQLEKLN